MTDWPKQITAWQDGDTGYLSVPFTWLLPEARRWVTQRSMFVSRWIVGGPAVELLPEYLAGIESVTIGHEMPGVLQRVNPMATRTTIGCPRRCQFCGIGQRKIEGDFRELDHWPDGPIVCDNNLTAASLKHFERVIERLKRWPSCDFNQGLDCRSMTESHAWMLAKLPNPIIRLALDSDAMRSTWEYALRHMRRMGVRKKSVRSYVLIGFGETPAEAWNRCEFVESHGIKAYPMWFHRLDAMCYNEVTPEQAECGWTYHEQKRIMGYYYMHRGQAPTQSSLS